MNRASDILTIILGDSPASLASFLSHIEIPSNAWIVAPFPFKSANMESAGERYLGYRGYKDLYRGLNEIIANHPRSEFVMFAASSVGYYSQVVARLEKFLREDHSLAGSNPLFVDSAHNCVSSLGLTLNFLGEIRILYPGLDLRVPLVNKLRKFRLGDWRMLLARRKDYLDAGGLNPDLERLAFFDLSLKMTANAKYFATCPEAEVETPSRDSQLEEISLWNSLRERGKLEISGLNADYERIVLEDGEILSLTNWLIEDAPNLARADAPYYDWINNPSPKTLLKYLAAQERDKLLRFLEICRSFPCLLPRQYAYYEVRAAKFRIFGETFPAPALLDAAMTWRESSRRFRYGELRAGMKALKNADVYNCSLDNHPSVYDAWIELKEPELARSVRAKGPVVAFVTPVWNTRPEFLRNAIDSVRKQTAENWELWLADDASDNPEVGKILREAAARDPRIHSLYLETNGHISAATNSAIGRVEAPWIAFLDHDDELSPDALASINETIASNPLVEAIYSDEDIIDEHNIRRTPFFRPDARYVVFPRGHLYCYRRELILAVGGLRSCCDGSQDFDLGLRVREIVSPERIAHIPRVLYHWRSHHDSSSGSLAAKPYVLDATKRALEDSLARKGLSGRACGTASNNRFLTQLRLTGRVACSVILMDRGELNEKLVVALRLLNEKEDLEIFFASSSPIEPESLKTLRARLFLTDDPIGEADKIAGAVSGEILLFLASDLEPLNDCHPEQLIYLAKKFNYAAVGGMLWRGTKLWYGGSYPDASGYVFPLLRGAEKRELSHFNWGQFITDHFAIGVSPECFAIKRDLCARANLFDPSMGDFMMEDFSLKMEREGLNTLVSPWGQWRIDGHRSEQAKARPEFFARWGEVIKTHGLRNPNLKKTDGFYWTLIL
ncbi:MAG: glycosyltransferase [Desulfovibrio sp.]|nr:glycosyltransferase [Desulfovibrio sp.]